MYYLKVRVIVFKLFSYMYIFIKITRLTDRTARINRTHPIRLFAFLCIIVIFVARHFFISPYKIVCSKFSQSLCNRCDLFEAWVFFFCLFFFTSGIIKITYTWIGVKLCCWRDFSSTLTFVLTMRAGMRHELGKLSSEYKFLTFELKMNINMVVSLLEHCGNSYRHRLEPVWWSYNMFLANFIAINRTDRTLKISSFYWLIWIGWLRIFYSKV